MDPLVRLESLKVILKKISEVVNKKADSDTALELTKEEFEQLEAMMK